MGKPNYKVFAKQDNGLPLGIQAQANDGLLLQLAVQIERALGGKWNGGLLSEMHVAQVVQVA